MATKKLQEGMPAPDFTLPDSDGNAMALKDLRGSWVVLYFYPRDNTSGCTTEALDFTARVPAFKRLKASIIGVSPDSRASHLKFMGKLGPGLTLLSDVNRRVLSRYGVWQLKKLYGKESYGVVRSTFLIDPSGVIRRIWEKVRVNGHAEEVLDALKQFQRL
ncbi:MAG: peroxiredoxin [Spirochaetes bacterium]|nr:peroxiredoxin [Spirochaetota bacterium]